MGIFDFLKRGRNDDLLYPDAPQKSRNLKANTVVKGDLSRLNGVQSGLGALAIAYVVSGKNETVLSTISNSKCAEVLDVGIRYNRHQTTRKRRALFARMNPYNTAFMERYSRLLAAALPADPKSLAGSKHLAPEIRIFFTELFGGVDTRPNTYGGPNKKDDYKTAVTPKIAIELVELLGGDTTDFFDAVYDHPNDYYGISSRGYRFVHDLKQAAVQYPHAFIKAASRVNADGRELMIKNILGWKVLDQPEFLDFVFGRVGDTAKKVREIALGALKSVPADTLESMAIEELDSKTIGKRAAMVELLSSLGTPSAMKALTARRKIEKSARIKASIDTIMAVEAKAATLDSDPDDASGYTAIDGSRVEIPSIKKPESGPIVGITAGEKAELKKIIAAENENIRQQIEENKRKGYKWHPKLINSGAVNVVVKSLSTEWNAPLHQYHYAFLYKGEGLKWLVRYLDKQSPETNLKISLAKSNGMSSLASRWSGTNYKTRLLDYLDSEDGDYRVLEAIDVMRGNEISLGGYYDRKQRKTLKGDFLRYLIAKGSYVSTDPEDYSIPALWPYLAENLEVFDEALGLRAESFAKLGRTEAISMLTALPKPPMRYFGPLLEAATGNTKAGRQEARDMLSGADDVDARLITLLTDTRQAVRSGAADWMGERNNDIFVKPLKARLKKEKSEMARAAMLSALDKLGQDLSSYVGPKALIAEAELNLKKAKFDKLSWLGLDHLPAVKFKSGARVPDTVLKWWIYLGFKLKEPAGNKLFQLYLEQLEPKSGQAFSQWILDSWVNYDTQKPSDEDANKHASKFAKGRFNAYKKWYKDYTEERAFADLKREFMGNYLNSGAATKGILALAYLAPAPESAGRVRHYVKNHGSRTSQSSSLLSVLAAKGDPVSLQVVISAATRLKQKGVQNFANELLQKVAESKGWTMDELADRTIPTAGFDDDGILELPCGPDEKMYKGILSEELKIQIQNPDGKVIKALASTPDDKTKESKKQLSTSRKELKQVIAMQSARLYEALCAERVWTRDDWHRNFVEHPIMRKLIERLVWLGLDKDNNIIGSFRRTAEGDYTDAEDNSVSAAKFKNFRLAHGAAMNAAAATHWEQHLEDYEITPLFSQFGRNLKRISDSESDLLKIEDRKGWVTDTFTVRGIASKLNYERGEAMDGGYFNEYSKTFRSAGIKAIIEFSGNCLPEENVAAAMISLSFAKLGKQGRVSKALKLNDIPPILLSECWNDYYMMAEKGAFDKDWERKMPWM